ncbi:MAG: DUF6298 domain-containing protein [Prevotellaceae bacterium]|nr:DUF6298 domain-containing protein [Prevotellaceae bacterium]
MNCKLFLVAALLLPVALLAQKKPQPPRAIEVRGEALTYTADERGNRVPDFSYAGYMAGEQEIPMATVRARVQPMSGDATATIQAALDYVATLPVDKNGLRGAVLLAEGTYNVEGALRMNASGVVLRGSGVGKTIVVGAGTDRQTLISLAGKKDRIFSKDTVKIADAYLPVNSMKIRVAKNAFKVGDNVQVHRPSTAEWIKALRNTEEFGGGLAVLGWKPGNIDIFWDRKVTAVSGDTITIDAPITTAIDTAFGGGFVCAYTWKGRVSNVGIENLTLQSAYDEKNKKDEAHRWMAVVVENAQDIWVRQVNFKHFAGSAVAILETAKRATVEDCKSLEPVSEIANERRNSFYTTGTQSLFLRCYAEYGMHDFAVGYCAAGPIVFVQCESHLAHNHSGTIDSWASGVLLDVVSVDGNALGFPFRGQNNQGAGWTAANSMLWQCSAAKIYNEAPPTAKSWSVGSWAQFIGYGSWESSNSHVKPRSLYTAQLSARLGKDMSGRTQVISLGSEPSTSPTVAQALALTAEAWEPLQTLSAWIDSAARRNPISLDVSSSSVKEIAAVAATEKKSSLPAIEVKNGWMVRSNVPMLGSRINVSWWSGSTKPNFIKTARRAYHITRYVPGRTGTGYTDDLNELTDIMLDKKIVGVEYCYALWYDRRRDDHERIRRMDGETWAPFYELPFARTGGNDLAWDGLSKYDLTKYNPWYWSRLRQFSDLADEKNLLLIYQHYHQHNIIEAGAHWADFPWRTANNVNGTPFAEPTHYAGDKRIFFAEQFYDVSKPEYRALHEAYIRKSLDNFAGNGSTLHFISAEYTGPLHFVQFWIDVIAAWEKETGKKVLIGLSTTKDVQDSILADPKRAAVVDVIDIRYWHYQNDGTAYEPKGGLSMAPRQHARQLKPKSSSFEQTYRAVSEYRKAFPGKAVVYSAEYGGSFAWAEFMAGGSLANISVRNKEFLTAATGMQPTQEGANLVLSNAAGERIVYAANGAVSLDLTALSGKYTAQWINPKSGELYKKPQAVKGGSKVDLKSPEAGVSVLWLKKK